MSAKPPFRADQVGSLLRPTEVKEARAKVERGEMSADGLREIEDRCIRGAVKRQETLGLQSITDGEYRRGWWNHDFLGKIDGEGMVNLGVSCTTDFRNWKWSSIIGRARRALRRTCGV